VPDKGTSVVSIVGQPECERSAEIRDLQSGSSAD